MRNRIANTLERLARYLRGNHTDWSKHPDLRPVLAFTLAGREFFELQGGYVDYPVQRATVVQLYLEEYETRCTPEFLRLSLASIIYDLTERTNNGKLIMGIADARRKVELIQARLNWTFHPDLILKLASVVFFDAGESPYTFDHDYSAAKVAFWKANGADAFFLNGRLGQFLPPLNLPEQHFQKLSEVILKMDAAQIAVMLKNVSLLTPEQLLGMGLTPEVLHSLQSLAGSLQSADTLLE